MKQMEQFNSPLQNKDFAKVTLEMMKMLKNIVVRTWASIRGARGAIAILAEYPHYYFSPPRAPSFRKLLTPLKKVVRVPLKIRENYSKETKHIFKL
jgi:hypothetical protein